MKIGLITIGEPVPFSGDCSARLHRTGQFALWCARRADVTWWTSAFDHFGKKFISHDNQSVMIDGGIEIRLSRGCGYRKNISIARIRDQRLLAQKIYENMCLETEKPDILICAVPPVEIAASVVRYAKARRIPVLLDLRDMWPDIFVDHAPKIFRPIVRTMIASFFTQAQEAFGSADGLIGITPEFLEWGVGKARRSVRKWDAVLPFAYNSTPPNHAKMKSADVFWSKYGIVDKNNVFRVCFFGTLGKQFDIPTVIHAAHELNRQNVKTQFVFCGDGERRGRFLSLAGDAANIVMPGWVDAASIYSLMRKSHVGIAPLPDRYDFLSTINNKSVEYLSAGLPIISCPDRGALARFLKEKECGVSFRYGDTRSLVAIIKKLILEPKTINDMSKAARTAFSDNFDMELVHAKMLGHFERVVREYSLENHAYGD